MKAINQYWREHPYIDLWSINHVLSGVVLGPALWKLGMPFDWSLALSLVLFIGWELGEKLYGIKEHLSNIASDIIFDVAGFLAAGYWYFTLGRELSWTALAVWITVFMIFNVWGFFAYEERKIDQKLGPKV